VFTSCWCSVKDFTQGRVCVDAEVLRARSSADRLDGRWYARLQVKCHLHWSYSHQLQQGQTVERRRRGWTMGAATNREHTKARSAGSDGSGSGGAGSSKREVLALKVGERREGWKGRSKGRQTVNNRDPPARRTVNWRLSALSRQFVESLFTKELRWFLIFSPSLSLRGLGGWAWPFLFRSRPRFLFFSPWHQGTRQQPTMVLFERAQASLMHAPSVVHSKEIKRVVLFQSSLLSSVSRTKRACGLL